MNSGGKQTLSPQNQHRLASAQTRAGLTPVHTHSSPAVRSLPSLHHQASGGGGADPTSSGLPPHPSPTEDSQPHLHLIRS